MNADAELAEAKAKLSRVVAEMPVELRTRLPVDAGGEPRVEIVHALYRYESLGPHEVKWTEVRELSTEEWDAAVAAHGDIYRHTRGLDGFPTLPGVILRTLATSCCGS